MKGLLLFVLVSLGSLAAQELPAAPHVKTLTLMQLASSTADAVATYRNDSRCYDRLVAPRARCSEYNPISRAFVMNGTPELIGYFMGETSVKLAVPLILDHFGHHKLARAIRYWGIGDNAGGAAISFAGHHR
ncbi:MAG: hypothetical protein JOZ80_02660 [Acidobacteriaceae bacterium]|nr:hypothetical protein [Acidobacteriaceae bacterium]